MHKYPLAHPIAAIWETGPEPISTVGELTGEIKAFMLP